MDEKNPNETPGTPPAQNVHPTPPDVTDKAADVVASIDATVDATNDMLAGEKPSAQIPAEPLAWEPVEPSARIPSGASVPAIGASYTFTPKTNTLAVVSLVTSLLSWVLLPFVGGIVGLVTGFMARNEIKNSNGAESGDGVAVAGIVIGGLNVLLSCLCVCIFMAAFVAMFASAAR